MTACYDLVPGILQEVSGAGLALSACVAYSDGRIGWIPDMLLGPPLVPFSRFFLGEGSTTKIDYRKKGTLILTSLLENLGIQSQIYV